MRLTWLKHLVGRCSHPETYRERREFRGIAGVLHIVCAECGDAWPAIDRTTEEHRRVRADGALVQDYYHARLGGRGTLRLDEATLHVVETLPPDTPYPSSLDTPQSTTAGMVVRWAKDGGSGADPAVRYMLRWETLPSNQDMPRATIPPPTRLRVYGFR